MPIIASKVKGLTTTTSVSNRLPPSCRSTHEQPCMVKGVPSALTSMAPCQGFRVGGWGVIPFQTSSLNRVTAAPVSNSRETCVPLTVPGRWYPQVTGDTEMRGGTLSFPPPDTWSLVPGVASFPVCAAEDERVDSPEPGDPPAGNSNIPQRIISSVVAVVGDCSFL